MSWPYEFKSGVTLFNKEKTYPGYIIYVTIPGRAGAEPYEIPGELQLLDMKGNAVHKWETPYPAHQARIHPNGNIVVSCRCAKPAPGRPGYDEYHMGGATGMLMELDWDGNIIFEHFDPNMHHDHAKLPNGNYMYVAWEPVPPDLAKKVRGGQKGTEHKDGTMFGDYFVEIDPQGNTVWEWHGIEHFDPDIDIIGAIHPREEWTHINDVAPMPDGNLMSSSRHTDGAFIIDRSSGDIIWRWGNTAYLDKETGQVEHKDIRDLKTMGGPHDAHVIEPGLPGEGNALIYDNAMYRYFSRAVEVDIKTGDIVWESESGFGVEGYVKGRVHFSPFISGNDRLPNGNTLICSGANGIIYEITPDKEMVWHWVREIPNQHPQGQVKWGIFRAYKYALDYCPQFANLPPAEGK